MFSFDQRELGFQRIKGSILPKDQGYNREGVNIVNIEMVSMVWGQGIKGLSREVEIVEVSRDQGSGLRDQYYLIIPVIRARDQNCQGSRNQNCQEMIWSRNQYYRRIRGLRLMKIMTLTS